jgi:predicted transcriptional regulator
MATGVFEEFEGGVVDAELHELAERVREAEATITKLVTKDKSKSWTIRELQDAAAKAGGWTPSVVSIAYRRLARKGAVLTVGSDLRVRAA